MDRGLSSSPLAPEVGLEADRVPAVAAGFPELLLRGIGISKVYSGKQKPLATLRQALFGTPVEESDRYRVLDDIHIEVVRGETVGILGRNGAGKTTLLGILGRVIEPTTGVVERYGRVATLLGLTAGFNPDFSGRENTYLFCSIQGLSRKETDQRIDGIREFADLGRYFELPVQSYSSGMQARLAFACAVHVDADLIIIDETLAVGDANFRMKCYDRITAMKESGQTFLLVSHNQNLVANFCTRGIVLEGGRKLFDGPTFGAVEAYKKVRSDAAPGGGIKSVRVAKQAQKQSATLEQIRLEEQAGDSRMAVVATLRVTEPLRNLTLNCGMRNHHGIALCSWDGANNGLLITEALPGIPIPVRFEFHNRFLAGRYFFTCSVHEVVGESSRVLALYQNCLSFDVESDKGMVGIVDLDMHVEAATAAASLADLTPPRQMERA